MKPHAPRVITEYLPDYTDEPGDPRVKRKMIDYDANGNQMEIREQVSDPEQPLGYKEVALRRHLWDEEDRLLGVDLNPEADPDKPEVAVYTYDAGGERSIRYIPGRFDAYYSAKEAGKNHRLEAILYPNSLVTVKTLPLPEEIEELESVTITKYTKHYYIGSERVASALGSIKSLGLLCESFGADAALIAEMNNKVGDAAEVMHIIYDTFEKDMLLPTPFFYNEVFHRCDRTHYQDMYHPYWYHPDHLGSSSYITNLDGEINQHLEYLPFGEALVEEHLSSYNSPFKFNAKEFDAETGNYYYGARYYDPKWSIWLSVDAEFAKFPSWSPYNYTLNNPINFIDPDGRVAINVNGDPPYKKWNKLNRQEKNIILWHPQFYKAKTIEKNAGGAFEMTKTTFGHQGKGDKSDAFRHAYWMALNTQEAGEEFSQKWGDAHEYSTPVNEVSTDLYMDIHNNDVGIEIGKNNPDASPEEIRNIILDRIDNGDLLIINENNKLIKSDGSLIQEGEIRRRDEARQIATDIINENK